MITITSLTHPTILCKVFAALRKATQRSARSPYHQGFCHVLNKNKRPILHIRHTRNTTNAWQIDDCHGHDITETVLTALRSTDQ